MIWQDHCLLFYCLDLPSCLKAELNLEIFMAYCLRDVLDCFSLLICLVKKASMLNCTPSLVFLDIAYYLFAFFLLFLSFVLLIIHLVWFCVHSLFYGALLLRLDFLNIAWIWKTKNIWLPILLSYFIVFLCKLLFFELLLNYKIINK